MNDIQALTTIVESNHIDLAIAGWLDAHKTSQKTHQVYEATINQYRDELKHIGHDLDSDVRTLAMVAQRFASFTTSPRKDSASKSTINQRLAILSSFYNYALARYLLMPIDDAGHVMNPIKIVKREKVQQYAGVQPLAPDNVMNRLKHIDRSTPLGLRDYALLAILLQTGRRLSEVTSLQWRHVHLHGAKITLTFEHCKGDKTMVDTLPAPVSRALLQWLYAYYGTDLNVLAKDAPLWVTLSRNTKQAGQPLGIQAIQQICQKHLGTHTHVTRHTFTHNMIKAGATLNEIQARLGHESLATTGRYARVLTSAENPHADKIAAMLGL